MLKKLSIAALTLVSVAALAQTSNPNNNKNDYAVQNGDNDGNRWQNARNGDEWGYNNPDWLKRYDTYAISNVDVNTIGWSDQFRIVHREMRDIPPAQAYTLTNFLNRIPGDYQQVLLKALVINYKQASMVRDEVAMARFGSDQGNYAWLSYPPLTWSTTPGQNSWSSITFADNGTTTTTTTVTTTDNTAGGDYADFVAMRDDSSRPMRMVMRHHGMRDIDYDGAIGILETPLNETERGELNELFHPMVETNTFANGPIPYSNAEALDACICLIKSNAQMVDHLDRYAWYNHFDANYYRNRPWDW